MMVPDESGRSPCRVDVHPWDRARALLPQAAQVSRAISFVGCPWTAWKPIRSSLLPMSEQNDCPIANEGVLCDRIGATKGDDWVA
jgi:hypothetical protein